ncbi:MAG TPA: sugar phosphate nucleotidyltransferase [Methylomirabilota bacterium]|jgi:glucose-1-phosphate cytidylyltransferase|nr:sugar phosphate nucleotidyltransferase [Methylomirabilota bacterium]
MKVVLFCGGLGTRLREYSETIPKPMVNIGYRPILWHVMKYYAHYGHTDFILCLGYRGDVIKQYFLNYEECLSNNFVLTKGGRALKLYSRDIERWNITFVDTGLYANIGQRLRTVEPYLEGDEVFLANYTDGLSDLPLPRYLDNFLQRDATASFLCVRPTLSFHIVTVDGSVVKDIRHVDQAELWINGGFFAFRRDIFDYIGEGEDLVAEPFARLIEKGALTAYKHDGFWACMDTFKDKQRLDDLNAQGISPWEVWRHAQPVPGAGETRARNGSEARRGPGASAGRRGRSVRR